LIPRIFFPHKIAMMPTGQMMACFTVHPLSFFRLCVWQIGLSRGNCTIYCLLLVPRRFQWN
jgi:hypothetical protein